MIDLIVTILRVTVVGAKESVWCPIIGIGCRAEAQGV